MRTEARISSKAARTASDSRVRSDLVDPPELPAAAEVGRCARTRAAPARLRPRCGNAARRWRLRCRRSRRGLGGAIKAKPGWALRLCERSRRPSWAAVVGRGASPRCARDRLDADDGALGLLRVGGCHCDERRQPRLVQDAVHLHETDGPLSALDQQAGLRQEGPVGGLGDREPEGRGGVDVAFDLERRRRPLGLLRLDLLAQTLLGRLRHAREVPSAGWTLPRRVSTSGSGASFGTAGRPAGEYQDAGGGRACSPPARGSRQHLADLLPLRPAARLPALRPARLPVHRYARIPSAAQASSGSRRGQRERGGGRAMRSAETRSGRTSARGSRGLRRLWGSNSSPALKEFQRVASWPGREHPAEPALVDAHGVGGNRPAERRERGLPLEVGCLGR